MIDIRTVEFRNFTLAQTQLLAAMRTKNTRLARQAREDLEALEMHTEWPGLRARCVAALQPTQH